MKVDSKLISSSGGHFRSESYRRSSTPSGQIVFRYVQKLITWVHMVSTFFLIMHAEFDRFLRDVLHRLLGALKHSWTKFSKGGILNYYCTGHPVLILLRRVTCSPLIRMALSSAMI
jgi:hypothetical protein